MQGIPWEGTATAHRDTLPEAKAPPALWGQVHTCLPVPGVRSSEWLCWALLPFYTKHRGKTAPCPCVMEAARELLSRGHPTLVLRLSPNPDCLRERHSLGLKCISKGDYFNKYILHEREAMV